MKKVFWFFDTAEALYEDQCQRALAEGRIVEVMNRETYNLWRNYRSKEDHDYPPYEEMLANVMGRPYTIVYERSWTDLVAEANQRQMDIVNDPARNLPMLAERQPMEEETSTPPAPTQEERIAQLEKENEELTLIVADLIGGRSK